MDPRPGATVVVPSKKVGQPERRGTIEQITRSSGGPRFWVRWDDGSRSLYQPHGAYQILASRKR
jgi:uncharacterized protein DUF1918